MLGKQREVFGVIKTSRCWGECGGAATQPTKEEMPASFCWNLRNSEERPQGERTQTSGDGTTSLLLVPVNRHHSVASRSIKNKQEK